MKVKLSDTSITDFWEWVTIHETDLMVVTQAPVQHAELLAQLQAQIRFIDKGLVCDLGISPHGRQQLILSAEGDQALFPLVLRIASDAPSTLHLFEVVAFRPAVDGHVAMVLDGFRLASDQLMCRVRMLKTGGVAIEAFVQDYDKDDQRYDLLVRLLLMHAVGEFVAVTKVKQLTLHPWPLPHQAEGLIPWVRLHKTIKEIIGEN